MIHGCFYVKFIKIGCKMELKIIKLAERGKLISFIDNKNVRVVKALEVKLIS